MPKIFGIRPAAVYLVFLLLAVAVFAASFDNSFRDDDFVFIRHSVGSSGLFGLLKPSPDFAFYRPGALLLFWIQVKTLGLDHGGRYLVFNFFIHVVNSILLVVILRYLACSRRVSYLSGGLFVLGFAHYGKQVMWACAAGPLVSVMLAAFTLSLYLRGGEIPTNGRLVAVAVAAAAAPAFHEIGLAAAVLAATAAWLPRGGTRGLVVTAVMAVVVAAWAAVYAGVSAGYESYGRAAGMLAQVPGAFVRYLGFMLFPVQPSEIVSQHPGLFGLVLRLSRSVQWFMGITVLAVTLYVLVSGTRQQRFLVVWLYAALVPFCFIKLPEGWLELRYLYFAAMPFCALFARLLIELMAERGRAARAAAAALLIAVVASTTYLVVALEHQYDVRAKDLTNAARMDEIRKSFPDM